MKADARDFLMAVRRHTVKVVLAGGEVQTGTVRDLICAPTSDLHHKRAWFLLEKWSNAGWYQCGVTIDLGWLTPKGEALADRLIRTAGHGFGPSWYYRDLGGVLAFAWTTTGLCGEFRYWHDDNGHQLESVSPYMKNRDEVRYVEPEELVIFEVLWGGAGNAREHARVQGRLAKIARRAEQCRDRLRLYHAGVIGWGDRTNQRGV